ncbi:bifunctional phosphoribosylaminoimidazolecarboxamide formyltransferase/IMP cyclohydrolase [Nanoarchaeota archaeon]
MGVKALISVYDKDGIIEFAKALEGFDILSTGGTAKLLKKNGVKVTTVLEYTGFGEMMDGRVKTLQPKILAGILADRSKHMNELKEHDYDPIGLVVCNLYPFKETVAKGANVDEVIENIDVGGVTIIRAAAKNHKDVIVIVDPDDYETVAEAIAADAMTPDFRMELARKAFQYTANYDTMINHYFAKQTGNLFPAKLNLTFEKLGDLRYGENKHQLGAAYKDPFIDESCAANLKQLHGKQLSYNNYLDINDALELVKDFKEPCAAIIKHTNPCGIAVRDKIEEAYKAAHEVDPMSAFGSIVALNRPCNEEVAEVIKDFFVEAVVCPEFEKEALQILQEKKSIRLVETGGLEKSEKGYDIKRIVGGLLVQTREFPELTEKDLEIKSKKKPSEKELKDMLFANKVCKHVKSNSIVFAKDQVAVGIGAGQMSRVDAVKIASFKAGDRAKGAVMSSDAFFPFRDGVDEAAKAGVIAVIQPGGSVRDNEVIESVDENKMSMVFTGLRLFKH